MQMVWSSGTIKHVHRQVEADMQQTITMTLIDEIHDSEHVDGVKFDVAAIFEYIIGKFSLSEKAKNGKVTIDITIDGSKLEGKLCHVTIGFKIVDVDAVDPNTGKKVLRNMLSDQRCFTVMTIIAKYNRSTYKNCFDYIFDFCNEVRANGKTTKDGTQWNPFLVPEPQDMKSHQFCLGVGGACKGLGVVHFCHLCSRTSDDVAVPNHIRCDTCVVKR
jgi:hypothetical protein